MPTSPFLRQWGVGGGGGGGVHSTPTTATTTIQVYGDHGDFASSAISAQAMLCSKIELLATHQCSSQAEGRQVKVCLKMGGLDELVMVLGANRQLKQGTPFHSCTNL